MPCICNVPDSNTKYFRSMKRARDVRDQLEGLMERVEIELTSNLHDSVAIRKVLNCFCFHITRIETLSLLGSNSRVLLPHSKAIQGRCLQDSETSAGTVCRIGHVIYV